MIKRLTLRNFKCVGEQVYDLTRFDLLVGRNNSGKSTILQALAIWQFCVDEFHRSRRTRSIGIQVVLPNFTALPIPEFILLWKDRTDRAYSVVEEPTGRKKQEFIPIEIIVEYQRSATETESFGVKLRYQSPQTLYAIPVDGWARFRECKKHAELPRIAYVPPFSGLEPMEKWLDISPIRQQVGKGQPGSVLRNLLLRVSTSSPRDQNAPRIGEDDPAERWADLAALAQKWFSVTIGKPEYDSTKDVYIKIEYTQADKRYDVIAGGSGFHQTLTLLAFLYGYRPTTILLDEPDAHLHVNLQREILDHFKKESHQLGTQFLIATHAEEFAKGVDASQIMSLLNQVPRRVDSTPEVLRAMSDVSNEEISQLMTSPCIVYVEGESDERILRAWAPACGAEAAMDKVSFKSMGGGGKENMKERADQHFAALKQIIPDVSRLMLFDYDSADQAFHPASSNPALAEWRRKNIDNYLLVPEAWRRAAARKLNLEEDDLFAGPALRIIDEFFADQNLTLPRGRSWRTVAANVFEVVDGKRILFGNEDALFHRLKRSEPALMVLQDQVAMAMTADEIHEDVHQFLLKLRAMTGTA